MRVSVVICSYDPEMYGHLVDAIESVLAQTYEDVELIVVVDGSEELRERVRADYRGSDRITVLFNEQNLGL
ncbi:MAG: glycosyltransferase, partial [Halobacteriales archaeon]|nr:glycosyltransferase [Halobacteriales archaeon]